MATFSLSSTSRHPRFDTIIGLDVSGKLFYCRKSTLLGENTTSYFAARFGPDSMMDPQRDHIDSNDREIYFIDRNPELFKHVIEYLRMLKLPAGLGTFQKNPDLWRAMRDEAVFYALDELSALLKVTYSCSPDEDGGQGILYWLGTNKGRDRYMNPYRRGVLDVSGWIDNFSNLQEHNDLSWGSAETKELFVHHRPMSDREPATETEFPYVGDVYFPTLLGCGHSRERLPVVVDLRKNKVSPTHYSLRYGACRGMDGSWNFEASSDGENWVLLHEGRRTDGHCLTYGSRQGRDNLETQFFEEIKEGDNSFHPTMNWPEVYCDYMERHYRHTWELSNVPPGQFFRYFRIIGADAVGEEGGCLHCIGLEIYGKLTEE